MLLNCLKCRKKTESKNCQVVKWNKGKRILLSKYAACNSKKSTFIKQKEASRLLSSLALKTPLSEVALLGDILFYTMNDMVNKFLLREDEFMPEMLLRYFGFTYSACGLFTKIIVRIQKFKENRRIKIYLSNWIRQSLLLARYGLWRF